MPAKRRQDDYSGCDLVRWPLHSRHKDSSIANLITVKYEADADSFAEN